MALNNGTEKEYRLKDIRVTVITERLIRIEKGAFTDEKTQVIMNRDFSEEGGTFTPLKGQILCAAGELRYYISSSSGNLLKVEMPDGRIVKEFYSRNLLGTTRTLDRADGSIELEDGIMSANGVALLDDSKSLLLIDDQPEPRDKAKDVYVFAYGDDYRGALRDFYRLTGEVPLIPRYALGNWWSRYRAYTQKEYLALMDTFRRKQIPISIATIDMDWHWVDVITRFGRKARPKVVQSTPRERYEANKMPGWTGYTWNTDLFPDHVAMLDQLHDWNYKVTLNVHPSQGIRFFEDCYQEMCEAYDMDWARRKPIPFDLTTPEKRKAYFDLVHHPLEAEGVDFWWIDWQQGTKTSVPGLDPLWLLNHYHTKDMREQGFRPMILSRYAGIGSHRYPLGFSGDTVMSWKSLQFQPYFTVNAANAGYTWWSHDIGGHMNGYSDEELYLRWIQFGVFSPINRLHSTSCEYMGKEPWKHTRTTETIASDYLRLRHRLIPYLYSANYLTHRFGIPICEPLYYQYKNDEAYRLKNEYFFGPSLIAAPITEQMNDKLLAAPVEVWLPEGRYTDIFNGRIYDGGQTVTMYRELDSIPVLAREGAILPLYAESDTNNLSMDQTHEIWFYRGEGAYDWYEDDGETMWYEDGDYMITGITMKETEDGLEIRIFPKEGNLSVVPEKRDLILRLRDISDGIAEIRGKDYPLHKIVQNYGQMETFLEIEYDNTDTVILIKSAVPMRNLPLKEEACRLVTMYQSANKMKKKKSDDRVFEDYTKQGIFEKELDEALDELRAMNRDGE